VITSLIRGPHTGPTEHDGQKWGLRVVSLTAADTAGRCDLDPGLGVRTRVQFRRHRRDLHRNPARGLSLDDGSTSTHRHLDAQRTDRPTGKVIIGLTLIVLLVMAIIERATSEPSSCSRDEPGRPRRPPKRQSPKGQAPFLKSVNPPYNSAEAHELTTQRKPMCVVEVSSDWGDRAAGR
jgi:hypothetical protein